MFCSLLLVCACAGDWKDGTGMSAISAIYGEYIYRVVERMGYDALTIGNHEEVRFSSKKIYFCI
jgi:hypothetical protein